MNPQLFNPGYSATCPACSDRRIDAFVRLLEASDRKSVKAMLAATRELRSLGFSVVVLNPNGKGAGR